MASRLAREQAEQRRWRLRPEWAKVDWFDLLVRNEFLSPDELEARQAATLRAVVRFAAAGSPYYRHLFKRVGLAAGDIGGPEDLSALPPLTRAEVQEHGKDLRIRALPPGHKFAGTTRTSGSTGQPVKVAHTDKSIRMFGFLKQRGMRWFRLDPGARYGEIRPARDLPRGRDGKQVEEGKTCRRRSWPLVGEYFETGPFFGFSNANPLESQVAWVEKQRIDYLLSLAADLEQLALGFQGRPRRAGLSAVTSISQQVTPEMRRRIEGAFGVPLHETYGLNEIGMVAARCPEGGRFHVHAEHCLVEIVDERGKPCGAGERGRVLVTGLSNAAMPLIRYDTDDLAEAVEGPCRCGRTLPSFGAIHGRYRRIALLPPGTDRYWKAFQVALADMPAELARPLRQYQMHQYRSGAFELRLVAAETLAPAFADRIRDAWAEAGGDDPAPLAIRQVDEIPRTRGGKFQDFTSDFVSGADG